MEKKKVTSILNWLMPKTFPFSLYKQDLSFMFRRFLLTIEIL